MAELQEVLIAPPPGVVKSDSLRVIEGRWSDVINMRFVKTKPEKLGGWKLGFDSPTAGVPRTLHAWRENIGRPYLAAGTYMKLYVYDWSRLPYDVTPIRTSGVLIGGGHMSTTAGSNVITVFHTAHALSVGDIIYLTVALGATLGGVVVEADGDPVATVIDPNHYTFLNAVAAITTATTTQSVNFIYEIAIGPDFGSYGYGFGINTYSYITYGLERPSNAALTTEPRIWSLDHFGQILIAAYNGGTIYQFDPTQAQPWNRAALLSSDPGLPTNVRSVFVTPERFIMALCVNMQVAWPSQGTLTDWTPSPTNTANIRTLSEGTKLVGGKVLSDYVSLIWSDAALYRFQYTGSTYIYASSIVGKDCGLVGPNAAVTVSGVAYWMGPDNFWTFNGTVSPMPNVTDIRKWAFEDVQPAQGYHASASYNAVYNEIWFFFTVEPGGDVTRGLIYSIDERCWAPLYWGRASGTHFTQGDTRPVFGGTDSYIYQHEDGNDANGAILSYSMTLAPYAMSKGGRVNMTVQFLVTDFFEQVGDITLTVDGWDRLNDSVEMDSEVETIAPLDTGTIDLRIGGRYIGMTAGADLLGSYCRLGQPVAFVRPIGDRS